MEKRFLVYTGVYYEVTEIFEIISLLTVSRKLPSFGISFRTIVWYQSKTWKKNKKLQSFGKENHVPNNKKKTKKVIWNTSHSQK